MSGSESHVPVEATVATVPSVTAKTPKKNLWASLGEGAERFQLVTEKPLTEEQIKVLWAETGIDHIETGEKDSLTNILVTTRELLAELVDKVLGADNVKSLVLV